jgi:hypothetical protein
MHDGATLSGVMPELAILALTSAVFLAIAAVLFSWNE